MADWGSVLLEAGIDVPYGKDEFNISCPLHSDSRASCSVNIDKGVWFCHSGCGQGSLKGLLIDFLGVPRLQIDKIIRNSEVSFNINVFDDEVKKAAMEPYALRGDPTRIPNWAMDRGFDIQTLASWGCRLDEDNGLEIPVRNHENRIVGSITRRPIKEPKYMYSKGLPKSRILFGAERIKESVPFVCVVEGSLDAMWLDQHGYPSVALLGMHLSDDQARLLRKVPTSELVIATDADEAGQKARERIETCIDGSFVVSYIELPVGAKDVQDIRDAQALHSVLANRNYW